MKTKNSHHSVPKSHRYMSHFANVALSGVEVQNTKCPSPFTRGSQTTLPPKLHVS